VLLCRCTRTVGGVVYSFRVARHLRCVVVALANVGCYPLLLLVFERCCDCCALPFVVVPGGALLLTCVVHLLCSNVILCMRCVCWWSYRCYWCLIVIVDLLFTGERALPLFNSVGRC